MNDILKYKNELIIIAAIILFFFIIFNINAQFVTKINELESKRAGLEDKKSISDKWKKLNEEHNQLKSVFFEGDAFSFKKFVEAESYKSDLNVASLQQPTQNDKGLYEESTIDFKGEASYGSILNFIKSVETNEKVIRVERLMLTRSKETKRNLDITLKSFILKK